MVGISKPFFSPFKFLCDIVFVSANAGGVFTDRISIHADRNKGICPLWLTSQHIAHPTAYSFIAFTLIEVKLILTENPVIGHLVHQRLRSICIFFTISLFRLSLGTPTMPVKLMPGVVFRAVVIYVKCLPNHLFLFTVGKPATLKGQADPQLLCCFLVQIECDIVKIS